MKVNGRLSNKAEEEIFVVPTENGILKLSGKKGNEK